MIYVLNPGEMCDVQTFRNRSDAEHAHAFPTDSKGASPRLYSFDGRVWREYSWRKWYACDRINLPIKVIEVADRLVEVDLSTSKGALSLAAMPFVHHAEVYSDGAVFYVGEITRASGSACEGVIEAHNYGGGTPPRDGVTGLDIAHASFAPGLAAGTWTRVDLSTWPEDCLFANYHADATLDAVYVRRMP